MTITVIRPFPKGWYTGTYKNKVNAPSNVSFFRWQMTTKAAGHTLLYKV